MTRREFALSAAALPVAAQARKRPALCVFSKHMANLDYSQLGAKAKAIGFDGVDLTVRPKGHVLPERVAVDLPRAVEAIRKHGLSVPMITTDLKDASDAAARPTFETMKKLGIPLYKVGYWRYVKGKPLDESIAQAKKDLQSLLSLGREYGVALGLHNHSGEYFGCSVWDYREILAGVPGREAGYYFDPGHSFIEGGLNGWRVSLDVVLPRLKMVAVKDFHWEKQNGKWRTVWCPLGEGMVDWKAEFTAFAKAGFTGPISLHSEYPGGEEDAAMQKDFNYMKSQMEAAYGV